MRPAKRVLIVEDNAAIRGLLEDVLQADGYAATVASSGMQALDQLREHRPDLMLLDLMLPDMNAWALLQARERDLALADVS
jgi:DNA-binding response OmpR family regulator